MRIPSTSLVRAVSLALGTLSPAALAQDYTDPDALTSQVGGVLHTIVGSRDVRREHKIFQFNWKYTGVSLRLKGFGVVVKKEDGE